MRILATLAGGASLFPSIPSNPNINSLPPFPPLPPLTLPLRKQKHRPLPSPPSPSPSPSSSSHNSRRSSSSEGGRAVLIGDSGVSYVLPGAPFEFQYSYSETPKDKPLAIHQPAFLPFAPQEKSLPWTGKTPRLSKKTKRKKNKKKKIRLFQPHAEDSAPPPGTSMVLKMACRRSMKLGRYIDGRTREEILGDPLTHSEVAALVEPYVSSNNQVNLGRDGLTHNMLELIHSHWRRKEVCRVRCRGVSTMDMDNICYHLEEKTGGKVINQIGGVIYLFRGRNYNPRTRPRYPVMLLKPPVPLYPKLIHETPEGLTKEEADELRLKGKNLLPICKLARNGVFLSLVSDVKDAFELSHLVKVNCQVLKANDHIKIGVKLKNLVPCVLLSFDDKQILMWRGKDWQSRYSMPFSLITKIPTNAIWTSSSGESELAGGSASAETPSSAASSSKMMALWKQALESNRALLLLDGTDLIPDSLLERVEEFERTSEAANSLNDSSKVDSADITTCKS